MSSPEDDNEADNIVSHGSKKRRVQRACDVCRRKKIRCDGGTTPDNRCTNCTTYNYDCTYVEAAKKRGPPKGYVESLETRLEKMEKLLNKLCPDADFSKELGGQFEKHTWTPDGQTGDNAGPSQPSLMSKSKAYTISSPTTISSPAAPEPVDDLDPSDDEVVAQQSLVEKLRHMKVNPSHLRFFGKSSSIMFIQTAMDMKQEYAGLEPRKPIELLHPTLLNRRPKYWRHQPWLNSLDDDSESNYTFPPADLMPRLIQLYWENVNDYFPLLHRPTFEASLQDGLHVRDEGFGSTVLLVCAIGARFCDDPRVSLKQFSNTPHSSGWEWFRQVQIIRRSLLGPPRLYDLQICCLTAVFLQGSSAPQACWTIIGVGIRLAQDVGAHRKKVYNSVPTVEEELWKRAFWILVSMDRSISHGLGRPCAIQDEDFDLEMPLECDDEYWTHPDPELRFKQPPGKPSNITFFNCLCRLNQILAFALRTIYSINKSKALLGFVGQQWEQHIVAELDSALNRWVDSVPDHLRWDPNRENLLFLNQSAHLYSTYYGLQIAVHRPFIPSPRKPSPLSFPSLAICTNAARSCTHILDVQFKRSPTLQYQNAMMMFTSGVVLLLNIWGGKRSGLTTDPAKEMADVHKCMKMLKAMEDRWNTAGRLWDILYELASVGDLPLPQGSPAPNQKRERDSDSPISVTSNASAGSSAVPADAPRNIAGFKRISREIQPINASNISQMQYQQPQPQQPQQPQKQPVTDQSSMLMNSSNMPGSAQPQLQANPFTLPIHSDELGRLPLHVGYNSATTSDANNDLWFFQGSAPPAPAAPVPTAVSAPPFLSQLPMNFQSTFGAPQAGPSTGLDTMSPMDSSMTSLFGASGMSMYDPIFPVLSNAGPDHQVYTHLGAAGGGVHSSTFGDSAAGSDGMDPGQPPASPIDGSGFPDNTLAMWSNAPTNFEWDDWGAYITNVSGMSMSHPIHSDSVHGGGSGPGPGGNPREDQ